MNFGGLDVPLYGTQGMLRTGVLNLKIYNIIIQKQIFNFEIFLLH